MSDSCPCVEHVCTSNGDFLTKLTASAFRDNHPTEIQGVFAFSSWNCSISVPSRQAWFVSSKRWNALPNDNDNNSQGKIVPANSGSIFAPSTPTISEMAPGKIYFFLFPFCRELIAFALRSFFSLFRRSKFIHNFTCTRLHSYHSANVSLG